MFLMSTENKSMPLTEEELRDIRRKGDEIFKEIQHADVASPIPWRKMSPEEYVARRFHRVGACSLHRYTYDDPDLNAWMKRFAEIITSERKIDEVRRSILTESEYRSVQDEISDILENGL